MGSGMIPYTPTKVGDALIRGGLAELERICEEVREYACEGGQYDNSFFDGEGVGELRLAIRLIRATIILEDRQQEAPPQSPEERR